MATLNEIEALADRAQRIEAYRELLRQSWSHSLAWFNLAVDELEAGDRLAARRAALQALTIDPGLRGKLPAAVRAQIEVAEYQLVQELDAGATQVLYAARTTAGDQVFLRALRDRPHAVALDDYRRHAAVEASVIELARARGQVDLPGGETFQVLDYEAGRPLGQLLRGDGPERGFGVVEVPRVDDEVAAELAGDVLGQLEASAVALDPNPDLWLRTRRGVICLGPPGLSPSLEWLAPEERDAEAAAPSAQAYRAALLVWTALTGRRPPSLDVSGIRTIDVERLPARFRAVGPSLQAMSDRAPARRLPLATLRDRLRAVAGTSKSGDGEARPVVPGYRLLRPLGEGGFGVVYEALAADGARVAVKVLHPALAASGDARLRFFNEAALTAKVEHPGIVKSLTSGSAGDVHYVVMELVDGESLDRRLARGPLTVDDAVRLGREVAAAVGAMHGAAHHAIHRDLKPGNIMLARRDGTPPWTARVSDFGIAKLLGEPTSDGLPFTRTGQWNGTPEYMAPEQWRQEAVDARTDVYALGGVLYECLAGRRPFAGNSYQLLEAHLRQAPPALPAAVPARLRAVVLRMLAKAPAERFATMAEAEAALAGALTAPQDAVVAPPDKVVTPPDAVVTPPSAPTFVRRAPRWPWLVGGAAVLAAVAVVALRHGGGSGGGGGGGRSIDAAVAGPADADIDARRPRDLQVVPVEAGAPRPPDDLADCVVVGGVRWRDDRGPGALYLLEAPTVDRSSVRMYGLLYADTTLVRTVKDASSNCGTNNRGQFLLSQLAVTDVDSDGVAEVGFAYATGCGAQVTIKSLVLEGGDKYILRAGPGQQPEPEPPSAQWPPGTSRGALLRWRALRELIGG